MGLKASLTPVGEQASVAMAVQNICINDSQLSLDIFKKLTTTDRSSIDVNRAP
jgi:hypothetical protein